MKLLIKIGIIGVIGILISCNYVEEQTTSSEVISKNIVTTDSLGRGKKASDTLREFPVPIDIARIKNSFKTTSGVLSTTESKVFCNPDKSYFFGFYFLINKTGVPFGKLTVYIPEKPPNWNFDTPNEKFAEIQLNSNDIKIWDCVSIGMKERDLIRYIGNNSYYKNGNVLCSELGEYTASFTILADTVENLKIGKYCKTE